MQTGKRPQLPDELEAFGSCSELVASESGSGFEKPEPELETPSFLVHLFRRCTEENPADRPTAGDVYEMLLLHTSNSINSRT